jgi:hypothetical protein
MKNYRKIWLLLLFLRSIELFAQHDLPGFKTMSKQHPIELSTIQGVEIKGQWHEPQSYRVLEFEKTEWSIRLPEKIMMAINEYFKKNGAGKNGLNPFDPEDIDVWAEIWTPGSAASVRVNGFYFEATERITEGDPQNWTWRSLITPDPFRFRFAPRNAGLHHVKLFAQIRQYGAFESKPFSFDALHNDPSEGFIELTPNHRYYQLPNQQLFFPVGQNLLNAHFCACEIKNLGDPGGLENEDCSTCYTRKELDPCCGLDKNERMSFWKKPSKNLRDIVEHPSAFIKMLSDLETLKKSGGNAYRTIITPIAYDFEFEKLNNYQDRQFMAWELDQLLDYSDSLDLKVELCMSIHNQFTHGFSAHWDWSDLDRWNEGFGGYCYYTARDKTNCTLEPASFFSEEYAITFYKKKLRYFFARYGYSASLLHLELLSEANNVGKRSGDVNNPDDWWGWLSRQLPTPINYDNSAQLRFDIGQWHHEMSRYIKEELQQKLLLACSYTGTAMMSDSFGKLPPCHDPLFDISQMSPYIDIIAHSSYDPAFDRWKKWSDHDGNFNSEWYRFQCPTTNKKGKQKFLGYPQIDRPVVHSENGNDLTYNADQQWFEKDLWCNLFGGYASSGMAWGMMYAHPRWELFNNVHRFVDEIITPIASLGTDTTWSVDWSEGSGRSDDARKLEMVYMKNNMSGKYVAFGILMNRTWNPANVPLEQNIGYNRQSFINEWEPQFKDGVDGISFMPFTPTPSKYSMAPIIPKMGQCNSFVITYYDPYTLEIINRADDDVILGPGVKLKKYPELTLQRPYVLFTVVRNGNCIEH